MINEAEFRVILASSVAAGIVGIIVTVLSEASLPFDLQRYVSRQAAGPISGRDLIALVIWAPAMVISLIAAIGMFFYWRPARVLALIGTLLALAALPFSEPFVATGLATLFNEGSSILWGMVLAVAYWSPLAQRFARSG
ncbi:MAG: hypothetical protein ACRD8O_14515 [Bryobacteraceae bacterium]